jgi:2-polyprenyl-6-methoxyphenol hydroxylase-like FAD-dependent oxidoreductase
MPLSHVLVLGAGPAGLAAALALSQLSGDTSSASLRITVLELRPEATTLGGSIHLTPLALRYLDRLGAGARLRPRGIPVSAIELLSLRTGRLLGRLWPDVDAMRVKRHEVVAAMLEAVQAPENAGRITVRYGARVVGIREEGSPDCEDSKVVLSLENGEEIEGDVLLGCDGLHSAARKMCVEAERKEVYSGKVVSYGYADVKDPGKLEVTRADGKPALVDTSLVTGRAGSLMMSFCEPSKRQVYLAAVMAIKEEHEGSKEGWRARAEDKARIKEDILTRFPNGNLSGLTKMVENVEDWALFPVYGLPPNGRWTRGRVVLLGDAAHAVSPLHLIRGRVS